MDSFPLATPRRSQELTIKEVEKAFSSGTRIVILEAPVGSGKSAIAMTLARYYGESHVITPRKSLQDQYYEDFEDFVVLMKGRSSYPCTFDARPNRYKQVIMQVESGSIPAPLANETNCSNAPCRDAPEVFQMCVETTGPCPYSVAMDIASAHEAVIHNLHSFIYQTKFGNKFGEREILIIDEAHEIESTVRNFITKKFIIGKVLDAPTEEAEAVNDPASWGAYFSQNKFLPEETPFEIEKKRADPAYKSIRDQYLERIEGISSMTGNVVVSKKINYAGRTPVSTTFEVVPISLNTSVHNLLLNYGKKVLLMSGTIYDKDTFCRNLGIDPEQAYFIRSGSSFPVANRPIYLKPDFCVDTSYAKWNENFAEMIEKIMKICNIFHDVKGLIHAPSYEAARQIEEAMTGIRAMRHEKEDLQYQLGRFYHTKENRVFISPVCQQGVDFKDDRARFQIIVRVPYLNTSDPFVEYQVKNNFPWYNHQALVVWGQQIGRINRNDGDFGATFCLDSRFNSFISKNAKRIPKWVKDAIRYK